MNAKGDLLVIFLMGCCNAWTLGVPGLSGPIGGKKQTHTIHA